MASSFHALLLSFPAQGHINPMLQLASSLISRGCKVTFVDTQRGHSSVLLAATRGIRFLTISDGLPDSFKLHMSTDALVPLLDGIQRQRGVLEKHIVSSKSSDNPISCIIADGFFPWAQDLAGSVGIPGVVLHTSNVTGLHFMSLRRLGMLTREAVERNELVDIRNICVSKHEILALFDVPEDSTFGSIHKAFMDGVDKASQVLVNSFRELEAFINLPTSVASKTRFVGPLLPAGLLDSKPSSEVSVGAGAFQENLEYTRWLEMQSKCSVLFISFGSVGDLSPAQADEIAAGLEESELKFLWVVRPDINGNTHLPEGFEERTKDRGQIIPWAEQLAVLGHPATGGFMTHCGWNSVCESICMGVPMLCLPAFAEQPINRDLVVKQWQVGMALQNSEGGVTREHVKEAARELMEGSEGKAMRRRARLWRDAARQAKCQGGSSHAALSEFIELTSKQAMKETI